MAEWYIPGTKRGTHPAKTFQAWHTANKRQFSQWDEQGNKIDALELGLAMAEGYVDHFGLEKHIEIIAPEMSIQIDVLDENGKYLCTFVCQIDVVYRNKANKRIGIIEHKTAKQIPNMKINSGYGDQGMAYLWAARLELLRLGILKPGQEIDHVMFNVARKALPDDRPKDKDGYCLNKDGTISKRQPSPLFIREPLDVGGNQLAEIDGRIRQEAKEVIAARKNDFDIYKNPMEDCDRYCAFKVPCELHSIGADYESVLDYEFKPWNPYDAHELREEKNH
jgi:hypothetical protein